MSINNTQHRNK